MSDGGRGAAVALTPVSSEVRLPPYRFWETRAGSGTPVVLIHGLGGSADWWRKNVEALAAAGHLVVAIDLAGFGRNRLFARRTALPLAFSDIAALLVRWIESSFDEPVHLAGNSMGGHIAIHVAAARPDLVRSLTLVNSSGIPFELAPMQHLENLIVPRGALSFATILARDAFRSGPTAIALSFASLLRDDARPMIRRITAPTLLLWGERDPLVPLSYARQLAEMIPGSRLVIVPDAGHIPMWENAEAFNRELIGFLREVESLTRPSATLSPRAGRGQGEGFSWSVSGVVSNIAYRECGSRRDVVLLHGLGMTSAYFIHLARCLFDRGLHAVAPDLVVPRTPEEDARVLIDWANALSIRNAVWVGHSLGCNVVAHLARLRPDLVREAICVGPLWTRRSHPALRLLGALMLDAFREPPALYRYVIPAYFNFGAARWWKTFRRALPDIRHAPPAGMLIAGERDPLPDSAIGEIARVTGAHACVFSDPEPIAAILSRPRSSSDLR
jgi:pimeloyl-ACP methyl ester carboxylesterase